MTHTSRQQAHRVSLSIPSGYRSESVWVLEDENINARNDEQHRTAIVPAIRRVKAKGGKFTTEVQACGLQIVKLAGTATAARSGIE